MRALHKTLAILAFLALSTQTARHAYVRWIQPRTSVLDKYDQPLKGEITSAANLDELVARYDSVRKQVDELRKENPEEADRGEFAAAGRKEPYRSEHMLRQAIQDWEAKAKELRELRVYWFVGLFILFAGLFIYKRNAWMGTTLLIAAFSEFIYWTSQTFSSNSREFDLLLTSKFVFCAISLILLLMVIAALKIFAREAS